MVKAPRRDGGVRKALTADAAAVATVVESDVGTARDAAVDVDLWIFIGTPDKTLTDMWPQPRRARRVPECVDARAPCG